MTKEHTRPKEITDDDIDQMHIDANHRIVQHANLDEIIENAKPILHGMLNEAWTEGELEDEFKLPNYRLAKIIVTLWGQRDPYNSKYLDKPTLQKLDEVI